MTITEPGKIVLPALRGVMGDRVYYSCLMNFSELALRVSYASEVHQHKSLSDMIQRQLEDRRTNAIAEYIETQNERFFNSLVVATYGGDPNWHPLANVRNRDTGEELEAITDDTIESVGFLSLNGNEELFAVDGQHRLAGIRQFVKERSREEIHDEVSVIFISHEKSPAGLQRTRRLFTTLNKTARHVSKGSIIALDEDDVMAICVRRLVESTDLFQGERVAFVAGNNIPANNDISLTTIGNLYDLLVILFTRASTPLRRSRIVLQNRRPSDSMLDEYYQLAECYFRNLKEHFEELDHFFSSEDTVPVVTKYRGEDEGSALFRPIGLDIFTRIIAQLTTLKDRNMELIEATRLAAKLPRALQEVPYEGLMWNPNRKTVTNANVVTLREILLFMVGASKIPEEELLERYRRDTGDRTAILPMPVM